MQNNELNKRIFESVKNRVIISNLEREENIKRGKRKHALSLVALMIFMLIGVFTTVNAAKNGELAQKVKNTVRVIFTDKDGTQKEIDGTVYTDSDNHTIEKYRIEKDGTEHALEVDKNNSDDLNLTIKENINDEGADITIEYSK